MFGVEIPRELDETVILFSSVMLLGWLFARFYCGISRLSTEAFVICPDHVIIVPVKLIAFSFLTSRGR